MKTRDYLSPTAIKTFYSDVNKFYCQYLSDIRVPYQEQTMPMAIGSAFDAYVKSYLHQAIYGTGFDPKYELDTLFEEQVAENLRDKIKPHGEYAFKVYKDSGALQDLLADLAQASESPQFEIEIRSVVKDESLNTRILDMVLLGKPDVYYKNKEGNFVILDWKVNGWFSKSAKSPNKGYMKLRNATGITSSDPMHKECVPIYHNGAMINGKMNLEDVDADWATQLAMYSWILGEHVGNEFIACIDQIVCSPNKFGGYPIVRVAEHRTKVGKDFQLETFAKCLYVWDVCKTGYIFRELSKEESDRKCATLDEVNRMVVEGEPDNEFDSFTVKKF